MKNHPHRLTRLMMACGVALAILVAPMVQAKSSRYAAHEAEMTRLAQLGSAGQLLIHRGDAFTPIAQHYAKVNDVPFNVALKGLKAVNTAAFANGQYDLAVGAMLVVPTKDEVLLAGAVDASVAPNVLPVTDVPVIENTETNEHTPEVVAAAVVEEKPVVSDELSEVALDEKTVALSSMAVPLWVWCLLAVLLMMIWVGRRSRAFKRAPEELMPDTHEPSVAPTVVLKAQSNAGSSVSSLNTTLLGDEATQKPMSQTRFSQDLDDLTVSHLGLTSKVHLEIEPTSELLLDGLPKNDLNSISNESTQIEQSISPLSATMLDDEDLLDLTDDLPQEPMLLSRFNQALGGLSANSLDLGSNVSTSLDGQTLLLHTTILDEQARPDLGVTQASSVSSQLDQVTGGLSTSSFDQTVRGDEAKILLKTQGSHAVSADSEDRVEKGFFNHSLKTPLSQLHEMVNVTTKAVHMAKAKEEAAAAIKVSEVLIKESLTEPLDMDVSKFLRDFSKTLPAPTYTSIDYEDLLDRTRLKEWLMTQTPEQLLLYAQDAHDARYGDVAQLILNDVLLRGKPEHCAAVQNLRHMWSYPKGVS